MWSLRFKVRWEWKKGSGINKKLKGEAQKRKKDEGKIIKEIKKIVKFVVRGRIIKEEEWGGKNKTSNERFKLEFEG